MDPPSPVTAAAKAKSRAGRAVPPPVSVGIMSIHLYGRGRLNKESINDTTQIIFLSFHLIITD